MIEIFVGDVTDSVRLAACAVDSNARLISQQNYCNLSSGTYYVSLGDLAGIAEFIATLEQADRLIYVPVDHWSDTRKKFSYMKHWTEFYLYYFYNKKTVIMPVSLPTMPGVVDIRKSSDPQLWIAGCSISHGVGVDPSERYGQLIADQLNMPVSFLTWSGSSIEWAKDQILRADIKSGDTLIWGITNFTRFPYYTGTIVEHVNVRYYEDHPSFENIISIDRLSDANSLYKAVTSIQQVVNYCNKLGIQVYFGGMLTPPEILPYLVSLPKYIQFFGYPGIDENNIFLDRGSDNKHPGVKTHQWYAKMFMERIVL